mmetsp:Transcript_27818/g.64574  ORF Transcript_27818/g.64574 Transcript_27818/m.64574 type:complete len:427 (+) Transcript_27818:92-1372(+)
MTDSDKREHEFLSSFTATLMDANGKAILPTKEALSGKIVGLYFSAHWCPPCRRFTPTLISLYNKLKDRNTNFELVFCSLDRSPDQYNEYTATMPWKCIPFAETEELRMKLAMKYGAQGIPHFVLIDSETRQVITDNGVGDVQNDPEGKNFPWKPKSFGEIWPSQYLTKNGLADSADLASKHLMLYFSAHWCPPCKMFTPKLCEAYKTMQKEPGNDFELVFVSSDRDEGSFNEYYGEMPFCALPYENRQAKEQLSKLFGVQGIPNLIMLSPVTDAATGDRTLINPNMRSVIDGGDFSEFPFHPKNYQDLSTGADGINEKKSIVMFCESEDDEEQADIINAIKEAARASKEKGEDYMFFFVTQPGGIGGQVRNLLSLKGNGVTLALLDIPDDGGFYLSTKFDGEKDTLTKEIILEFLANPGARQQMSK